MIPFQKGVKFVTAVRQEKDGKVIFKEQRLSRALEDYTRWVKAALKDEKRALAAIRTIEEEGFDELDKYIFRNAFQNWKKEDKSRKAKENVSKRGQVKRKDDKRLGARPPG